MIKYFTLIALTAQVMCFAKDSKLSKTTLDLIPSYIRDNRSTFIYPDSDFAQKEQDFDRRLLEKKKLSQSLARIKAAIINGDYELARVLLLRSKYNQDFTLPIQSRYLAMMEFVEGNYAKSLKALKQNKLQELQHQDRICLLRTLNHVVMGNGSEASENWIECRGLLAGKSVADNVWMDAIVSLKFKQQTKVAARPLKGLSIENERGDLLRLYLKLALYLNEPELILKRMPYLSEEVFSNPGTRELLGLLLYRNADFVKAYELIEDLSTPNSENIKGNIFLAQGKLELAYAQFKVALKRKSNSQNALERIIPTAWRLNQWSDGVEFTKLLETSDAKKLEKLTLEAALLTKNQQFDEALNNLKYIVRETRDAAPLEVNQLYAYNSLISEDKNLAFEYANKACKQQDAFACWMRSHMFLWEDFTLLTKREDKVFEGVEDLLEQYTSDFQPEPIEETVFVDQRNIEELEDAQIELIPTP